MKVRSILIGTVVGLLLPLAAADARVGAGASLDQGALPTAQNFGRHEDEDRGRHGDKCDKYDRHDKRDKDDWRDKHDKDDHCRCSDRGDKCDKSPSRPY